VAAPRYVSTHVVVEPLDFDTRHWCRSCGLPSGIRQWVAVRWMGRMHLQVRVWCDECGGHDIEVTTSGHPH
jgi:hypothetical protein